MAQSPTQEYKDVWARKAGKVAVVQIRYKRRYWNGSAFVYETNWQTLDEKDFKDAGNIVNNLDTPFLNIFKTSAVTLRLNNSDNQWLQTVNSPSIFQADAIALLGYDPFLMKFQVRFGYEKIDGNDEYITLFTGVATDYKFAGSKAEVEVTVESNDRLLQAADASKVSDAFTQESTSPAAGDGNNKEFFTTSTGVGRISEVRTDGNVQIQGTGYTISNLNVAGEPAKITFEVAPGGGLAVDSTGIKWKADLTIDELIVLLCDEAGIGSGVRSIDSVIFPGGLSGNKTINSKADWDAGLQLQNITTIASEGDISQEWYLIDDFANGNFTFDPAWTLAILTGNATAAVISNRLETTAGPNNGQVFMSLPQPQAYGAWEIQMEYFASAQFGSFGENFNYLKFISSDFTVFANGYGFWFDIKTSHIWFIRWDGLTPVGLINFGNNAAVDITWRITRSAGGEFKIYKNTVLAGTVTDNTYTTSTHITHTLRDVQAGNQTVGMKLDSIHWSPAVEPVAVVVDTDADYISKKFNILSVPTAWGTLDRTEILDGGTITYFTRVASALGGPYDAWVEIGPSGQILSALKQYIQVKIEVRPDIVALSNTSVQKLVLHFTTTTVNVTLANFSGLTAKAAIEQLTRIADYEILFKGDGDFIFRSKTVSGSFVLEINQENAISKLTNYTSGFKQIFNVGQVQYGDYFNEYDGASASESSPTSEERFGRLIRFEDYSKFLVANDINLGASRARLIYDNNFAPRIRCRIACKIIPWLELSDIIRMSYYDNPLFHKTIFGDPLQKWGIGGFGDPSNVLARDINFKIVGITFTPTEAKCELTLQKIL